MKKIISVLLSIITLVSALSLPISAFSKTTNIDELELMNMQVTAHEETYVDDKGYEHIGYIWVTDKYTYKSSTYDESLSNGKLEKIEHYNDYTQSKETLDYTHGCIKKIDNTTGEEKFIIFDYDYNGFVISNGYIYYMSDVVEYNDVAGDLSQGGIDYVRTDLNGNNREILYHDDYIPHGSGIGGPPEFFVTNDYLYVSKYTIERINLNNKQVKTVYDGEDPLFEGQRWIKVFLVRGDTIYFTIFDNESATLQNAFYKYDIENVAGAKYIKWSYESPIGKSFVELLVKRKMFSKLYGKYCDTKFSAKKIPSFIKDFNIDMDICTTDPSSFKSFNDFFIRKLTNDARPINKNKNNLISPGDGRLMAYTNISIKDIVQVKGIHYSLGELLHDDRIAEEYEGGICLVLRLCPTDYHRLHFVDSGTPQKTNIVPGNYYSVNPTALERIPKLYCQNKREWCIFNSDNFGDIIYVEVGATCVGSIIQKYKPNKKVTKGDEKSYFKFGGSTTILFFKKDTVIIDDDILLQSSFGFETKVHMGEKIGEKFN